MSTELLVVVLDSGVHHRVRLLGAVDRRDIGRGSLTRDDLVSLKVVPQPLDEHLRQLRDVRYLAPDIVVLQDGDYLVVRFALVDELKAADDARVENDLRRVIGRSLTTQISSGSPSPPSASEVRAPIASPQNVRGMKP